MLLKERLENMNLSRGVIDIDLQRLEQDLLLVPELPLLFPLPLVDVSGAQLHKRIDIFFLL